MALARERRPTLVITPDAPNAIEHYDTLTRRLGRSANVVCIEAPGSGFSFPRRDYDFSIERIAAALGSALEHLDLGAVAQYRRTRLEGGHFAALEEPELLVEDVRAFFRPLRFGAAND